MFWGEGGGSGRLIRGSASAILLERERERERERARERGRERGGGTKAVLRQNDRSLDQNSTLAPPEIKSKASLFDAASLAGTLFSYEIRMCTSNMSSSLGACLYLMQK
jgi:hypothetical protein